MAMHIQQNYDTKPKKKKKKASSHVRSVCDETSVYIYIYVCICIYRSSNSGACHYSQLLNLWV